MTVVLSDDGFGNGISWVISDSLCNLHLTSTECFERAVRLPAAMRAAKEVAVNNSSRLRIMKEVRHRYLEMAEKEVIRRAHTNSYLRRMKKKCQSVTTEGEIVSLTADSDNNGGEDTSMSATISTCGQRFNIVQSMENSPKLSFPVRYRGDERILDGSNCSRGGRGARR